MLSMFDNLVFGTLVLMALAVSSAAQADPQINDSGRRPWEYPPLHVEVLRPPQGAPSVGFNPQYRPDLGKAIRTERRDGNGAR